MQIDGIHVIANVRLSGSDSVAYALAGIPYASSIAIGLHGCTKSLENRSFVLEEVRLITDLCKPENLIVYGSAAYGVLKYPLTQGVAVHIFRPDTWNRSSMRVAA